MDIKVKIPENLNISEQLEAADIKPKRYLVDKIAFLCYEIHLAAVYHRDNFESKDRPYLPLYSKILQKYIKDYAEIEDILIEKLKVIECNDKYSKRHHKSFGFRFTKQYYGQKLKEHEIVTVGLHNKIQKFRKDDTIPVTPDTKPYLFLKEYWTNGKLKMDTDGAMNWINATYQTELNRLDCHYAGLVKAKKLSAQKAGLQKTTTIKKLTEKVEIWRTSVEKFNTGIGRLVFHPDDFSKRLHTKITNLKKELRGFLTYNGEQMVSLDIKNSQPYLSLVLFNEDFWRERGKKGQKLLLYRKIGLDKIKREVRSNLSYTIMLAKTSKSEAGQGFEFGHFCSLVTSGTLYEFLIKLFREIRTKPFLRDEVKRQFLIYLYYDPSKIEDNYLEDYPVIKLLNEVFPNISELFLQLKKHNCCQFPFHMLKYNESFKFPPQLLQRIESYLVIEVVCKGLKKGNTGIPLFTIHDSIVTTKKFQQIVHDKMIKELTNAIGYQPTIKPEELSPLPAIINTDFAPDEITEIPEEMPDLFNEW